MLRFGTISEIDGDKGLVRVQFDDADIVSAWLPMIQKGTKGNRYFAVPDKQEHVAVLMDAHSENGVCLGAIYSSAELPGSVKGKDVAGVAFSDGTVIKYDRGNKTLTVSGPDNINVQCETVTIEANSVTIDAPNVNITGDLSVDGDIETTAGNVKAPLGNVIAGPLSIGLTTHKHTGVTSGPSTTLTPVP